MVFGQWVTLAGNSPLKELFRSERIRRRNNLPISSGIKPRMLLSSRTSVLRKVRFPTWGDREPTSAVDDMFSSVTLWWRRPQVTPFQWQKRTELFHELKKSRGSPGIMSLIASRAWRSVSLVKWMIVVLHVVGVINPTEVMHKKLKHRRGALGSILPRRKEEDDQGHILAVSFLSRGKIRYVNTHMYTLVQNQ